MELRVVKTLWGVDDAAHPERWPALFARIKVRARRGAAWRVWRAPWAAGRARTQHAMW